ncbi:MAG: class I SAM-dependent methyltransferase [Alphaproteobacteria bacterium]|nr:class I SAM-dependent methyltransferase [Alphaproteobacteria bacterium]
MNDDNLLARMKKIFSPAQLKLGTVGGLSDHNLRLPLEGNLSPIVASLPPEFIATLDPWSQRFARGHVFGNDPSICGVYVTTNYSGGNISTLEIGCGTGRDAKSIVDHGMGYIGYDTSLIAILETGHALSQSKYYNGSQQTTYGDIVSANIPQASYDIVFTHRTLHLPDPTRELPMILNKIRLALKNDGKFVATFRLKDEDNFDPETMIRLDDYTAAYDQEETGRIGHIIHSYDKERLDPLLSRYFTNLSYSYHDEIESCEYPNKKTKLIMVTGDPKKTDKEHKNGTEDPPIFTSELRHTQ